MHPAVEAARLVQPLLAAQAQALREGRADDLLHLAPGLQHALGVLSALAQGPLPPAFAAELAQLQALAGAAQPWAARRQAAAAQALDVLAQGHDGLRQREQMRTYGRGAGLTGGALRGTGFGRA